MTRRHSENERPENRTSVRATAVRRRSIGNTLAWIIGCVVVLAAAPSHSLTEETPETHAPEAATTVTSKKGVVAADHPTASKVGARILKQGGSATDAGIATMLALGVVNPFSSGLGGGGFCLRRGADSGKVTVMDFRERAPLNATADMYVEDGDVQEQKMVRGGLAVGVPGEAAGMWSLHHRFGAIEWSELFDPAHRLAHDGHQVSDLLVSRLRDNADKLRQRPELARTFQGSDGNWVEQGETLVRPKLADTLSALQQKGPRPMYHGEMGQAIVRAVNEAGGIFQMDDLRTYSVTPRKPVRGEYRGYDIFSMPPSSSGGTAIIETLNILEGFDIEPGTRTAQELHWIVESLKHAFADRAGWLGDSDFVDVPLDRLTSEDYARQLRGRIKPDDVLAQDRYGSYSEAPLPDDSGTSHLSVVDSERNMLSCTTTINLSFGSMVFVPEWGLIMNDEMGDFTAKPGTANNYGLVGTKKNAIAPRKRPLSSMSPTLVLNPSGEPYMAVGASGGPTIITGTLMTMINSIDYEMSPEQAIIAPRLHHQWKPNTLFLEDRIGAARALTDRGHSIEVRPTYSNVQMIVREDEDAFTGVSDPRKGGEPAATTTVERLSK